MMDRCRLQVERGKGLELSQAKIQMQPVTSATTSSMFVIRRSRTGRDDHPTILIIMIANNMLFFLCRNQRSREQRAQCPGPTKRNAQQANRVQTRFMTHETRTAPIRENEHTAQTGFCCIKAANRGLAGQRYTETGGGEMAGGGACGQVN